MKAVTQTSLHPLGNFTLKQCVKRCLTKPCVIPQATVAVSEKVVHLDANQINREGSYEAPLVKLQASKLDEEQPSIASILLATNTVDKFDVAVVGCGPSGLALAAELGKRGLSVTLIGADAPFVNNYGVWRDEFVKLGFEDCLDMVWDDATCFFEEGKAVKVGRAYGRVCRRRLRSKLLLACAEARAAYIPGHVINIDSKEKGTTVLICSDGKTIKCRLAILASGAAAGRFLKYEEGAPGVAAQTAYGIEASVEGYEGMYDANTMLFMDFRRHHTGLNDATARRLVAGQHPNGGDGLWGTTSEVPSFLYAMPLDDSGRVFLEETCLVAKPALPFAVLKRRLERRCAAAGIKIKTIHEEEWSYIPTGGPLPIEEQDIAAFGAAANLVHPATGYSIARSLREAPGVADAIAKALDTDESSAVKAVWQTLWSDEKRRQAAFHVFGMELLCSLDLTATCDFFTTFFNLPDGLWRGFLASTLSSTELLGFALVTFGIAPLNIKAKLVSHMLRDPSGAYMLKKYLPNE